MLVPLGVVFTEPPLMPKPPSEVTFGGGRNSLLIVVVERCINCWYFIHYPIIHRITRILSSQFSFSMLQIFVIPLVSVFWNDSMAPFDWGWYVELLWWSRKNYFISNVIVLLMKCAPLSLINVRGIPNLVIMFS